jgi:hypothetical protein
MLTAVHALIDLDDHPHSIKVRPSLQQNKIGDVESKTY